MIARTCASSSGTGLGCQLMQTNSEDFSLRNRKEYGIVGYFVCEIAKLEYEIDRFIFTLSETYPKFAWGLSRKIPFKTSDKIEFVVSSYICLPRLREVGDINNELNLNVLAYGLEEIFEFRNILVHGRMGLIESNGDFYVFEVSKYKIDTKNRSASIEKYRYSSVYIDYLVEQEKYIRTMLWRGSEWISDRMNIGRSREVLLKGAARLRELGEELSLLTDSSEV